MGEGKSVSEEITSIPKNSVEKIVFQLNNFEGRNYVDMRIFLINRQGVAYPTKKALSVPVHLYTKFKDALLEVDQELLDRGLVDKEYFGLD
jgi:hypothetical protein